MINSQYLHPSQLRPWRPCLSVSPLKRLSLWVLITQGHPPDALLLGRCVFSFHSFQWCLPHYSSATFFLKCSWDAFFSCGPPLFFSALLGLELRASPLLAKCHWATYTLSPTASLVLLYCFLVYFYWWESSFSINISNVCLTHSICLTKCIIHLRSVTTQYH